MKSRVCDHEYDHDGWPNDEPCPICFEIKAEAELDEIWGMDEEELHLREARQKREKDDIIVSLLSELERIEWVDDGDGRFCPWCGNYESYGRHDQDCTKQLAIIQAKAVL